MVAKGSLKICCREISTTFLQDETPKWKGQEWNSNIVGHEGIAQLTVKKINKKKPWFSWLCDRSLSNKKEANNLVTITINHFASYQLSAVSRWCVWNEQGSDGNQICLFEKFHQKSKLFYSNYPPNQDQFPRTSNRCQISSELLWCYEYLTCKERSVW